MRVAVIALCVTSARACDYYVDGRCCTPADGRRKKPKKLRASRRDLRCAGWRGCGSDFEAKIRGDRASARRPRAGQQPGPRDVARRRGGAGATDAGRRDLDRRPPVEDAVAADAARNPSGDVARPPSRGRAPRGPPKIQEDRSASSSIRRRWERWRDLTRAQLVKTHGRLIHVFVASADLGRAWHAHGAWSDATDSDEAGFYARGVPVSKPGRLRALASFVIDGDALRICVSESSVHAHPSSARTLVLASTETALDVGAPTPFPNLPWDVSSAKKFAKAPFTDDGELKQEFRTTRDDVPACRAAGDVDVTLEALSASQYHHASDARAVRRPFDVRDGQRARSNGEPRLSPEFDEAARDRTRAATPPPRRRHAAATATGPPAQVNARGDARIRTERLPRAPLDVAKRVVGTLSRRGRACTHREAARRLWRVGSRDRPGGNRAKRCLQGVVSLRAA